MLPEIDHTPHAGTAFSNIQEQHITYLFAIETLPFRHSLDIGCGEGYGSRSLSTRGRVVSLDFSLAALQTIKRRYPLSAIHPLCMNATALGFKPQQFDLIIASHIIEHFAENERDTFLSELVRVLHPDGVAVIATPNHPAGIYYQHGGFHKILYDDCNLRQVLAERFVSVELYGVQEQLLRPIVRPLLRTGKRILQLSRLLANKGFQNAIARTSTSSTFLNFKVTGDTRKARNLIAVCRSPILRYQETR
jgi:SAM-dependent methyltransferase